MAELKRAAPWDEDEAETPAAQNKTATVKALPKKAESVRRVNFDVPESLHKAMKVKAAENGETVADVGRRLFQEWVGE